MSTEVDKEVLYLAGPIDGKTDEECHGWRNHVTVSLSDICNLTILNPMRRDYRGLEKTHYRTFVHFDEVDIRNCTIVLAYIPNQAECCSCGNCYGVGIGTTMEIAIASMLDKYIVIVSSDERIRNHPWMKKHTHYRTDDIEDAIDHLWDLLTRESRWVD